MHYTHLTEEERYQIDDLKREGFSKNLIAKRLGRSRSTLSKELRRKEGARGWRPRLAQQKATERLVMRGASNAKRTGVAAWDYAKKQLQDEQWTLSKLLAVSSTRGMKG